MSNEPDQTPAQEPSVLDYVKSLFRFGGNRVQVPEFAEEEKPSAISDQQSAVGIQSQPSTFQSLDIQTPFPWRSLLALVLALLGQSLLEPPLVGGQSTQPLGLAFYVAALSALAWGLYRAEWKLAPLPETSEGTDPLTYRRILLFLSVIIGFWAFTAFDDNLFTSGNVVLWLLAVVVFLGALWQGGRSSRSIFQTLDAFFNRDSWNVSISRWTLLLVAATALVFFFRFYQTTSVPPEPFSDHAEKILDVYEISQGQTHIFFIRNTGREAFQMYWTLLIANLFGTGFSYLSLKLGTAILGFLTLPFIYLLGKEIGGPRVGLIAFVLVGIAYWPNVISRMGLRFPLYPLFVAPTLLYLIRGLRTRNRNDFLLSGLFLGIGLHGYSPFRIVPFVVVAAFLLYWLHSQSKGARRELPIWLVMLGLTSLFVFIPLLRYWYDEPQIFGFRAMTRLSSLENPIEDPVWQIFLSNVWNALKMFNFDDGEIWVHSVAHRPALDVVSGALFVIGVVLVLVRYIRQRHWLDLFLLVSIPLLLLPSILSIAFPRENPALNRAGGAYIPVFIIGAIALDTLLTSLGRGRMRSVLLWAIAGFLLYVSASQNYELVFNRYTASFRQRSWNTSDMGKVIREFEQTYGRTDTVWVVPFPHWVDTRLPAVWAGIPNRDMAMWRENLAGTVEIAGPKLFMVKANNEDPNGNDQETLNVLGTLYPDGQLRLFDSDVPGHDIWIFFVPEN
ncbi:MAG TPA: glycosyltransferase family 39 protein [Anaerolineales bacterium]|nr:glycosyltransferase family 39 protein [Anaerolineales bacterium]